MVFDELLSPISKEKPEGESLLFSKTYDEIKEARRSDNTLLYEDPNSDRLKKTNWGEVIQLCTKALQTQSKDWQLVLWLCEGYAETQGLEGMRDAISFVLSFGQKWWNKAYPNDLEHLYHLLAWWEKRLGEQLHLIPITHPNTLGLRPYHLQDWVNAQHLESVSQKDYASFEQARSQGEVTLEDFLSAFRDTSLEFVNSRKSLLEECLKLITDFKGFLDKADSNSLMQPSFKNVILSIQTILDLFKRYSTTKEVSSMIIPDDDKTISTGGESKSYFAALKEEQRSAIYEEIRQIAKILERLEPHSPTPFLLKQIGLWEDKSLGDILQTLSQDPSELPILLRVLGISRS